MFCFCRVGCKRMAWFVISEPPGELDKVCWLFRPGTRATGEGASVAKLSPESPSDSIYLARSNRFCVFVSSEPPGEPNKVWRHYWLPHQRGA